MMSAIASTASPSKSRTRKLPAGEAARTIELMRGAVKAGGDADARHLTRCVNTLEQVQSALKITKTAIASGKPELALFYISRLEETIAFNLSLGEIDRASDRD